MEHLLDHNTQSFVHELRKLCATYGASIDVVRLAVYDDRQGDVWLTVDPEAVLIERRTGPAVLALVAK